MTIELVVMILALLGALVAAYSAWASDAARWKRLLVVLSVILAIAGIIGAFESSARSRNKDEVSARLEREWTLLLSSPVKEIEFELFADGGFIPLEKAEDYLRKIQFSVEGTKNIGLPNVSSGMSLSSVFTRENLSKSGILGIAVADVEKDATDPTTRKVVRSDCLASAFTTATVLASIAKTEAANQAELVCDVRVSVGLAGAAPTLSDILKATRISLRIPNEGLHCKGPCRDVLMSVRAVLPSTESGFPSLVEISPMIHSRHPTEVDADTAVFSLPGETTLALTKSNYLQSYGFVDKESFPMTTGALHALYVYLTRAHVSVRVADVIWSTTMEENVLNNAIDPSVRNKAEFMEGPDWCGYGDRGICWHRFVAALPVGD
jgi:hypothetical protein